MVHAALLMGFGVLVCLGALAAVAAYLSHPSSGVSGGHRLIERPFTADTLALVAPYRPAPEISKFPRMPAFKHAGWQPSDMDEGSVIASSGEILVVTPPKPKTVAMARPPLVAGSFVARAEGVAVASAPALPAVSGPVMASSTMPAPVMAAAAVAAPAAAKADGAAQQPFSLVLASASALPDEEVAVPLPVTRPKRAAPAQALAYAAPDDDIRDNAPTYNPVARLGARSRTAIYSIEAKTVYMPNGERLEAHSGLGPMLDNPRYVHKKMRGATPPHTYTLTMREKLFHGVEAIRLNPVEPGKIFGRDGLLAHTYMLGPRGDSNGCVSFKNYRRFLAAFKRGEVTQLVVVARLPASPTSVASR
ncbi:MAG: tlde1 domain-containing protein [Phyllobacterium sp.]